MHALVDRCGPCSIRWNPFRWIFLIEQRYHRNKACHMGVGTTEKIILDMCVCVFASVLELHNRLTHRQPCITQTGHSKYSKYQAPWRHYDMIRSLVLPLETSMKHRFKNGQAIAKLVVKHPQKEIRGLLQSALASLEWQQLFGSTHVVWYSCFEGRWMTPLTF